MTSLAETQKSTVLKPAEQKEVKQKSAKQQFQYGTEREIHQCRLGNWWIQMMDFNKIRSWQHACSRRAISTSGGTGPSGIPQPSQRQDCQIKLSPARSTRQRSPGKGTVRGMTFPGLKCDQNQRV